MFSLTEKKKTNIKVNNYHNYNCRHVRVVQGHIIMLTLLPTDTTIIFFFFICDDIHCVFYTELTSTGSK